MRTATKSALLATSVCIELVKNSSTKREGTMMPSQRSQSWSAVDESSICSESSMPTILPKSAAKAQVGTSSEKTSLTCACCAASSNKTFMLYQGEKALATGRWLVLRVKTVVPTPQAWPRRSYVQLWSGVVTDNVSSNPAPDLS